jgi:hypothetical protein
MGSDLQFYRWSQGDLNPRPLACHLSAQSSAVFTAVQNRPLNWTDAGVVVRCGSYPFGSVAAPVAAIGGVVFLVLFGLHQICGRFWHPASGLNGAWRPLSACQVRKSTTGDSWVIRLWCRRTSEWTVISTAVGDLDEAGEADAAGVGGFPEGDSGRSGR